MSCHALSSCSTYICIPAGILELCYHGYLLATTKMTVPYGMCYPIVQYGVEIPNRVFVGRLLYNVSLHGDPCMLHAVPGQCVLLDCEWVCSAHRARQAVSGMWKCVYQLPQCT